MVNRHENFMRLALELAKKGLGKTSPNPMVGAVIVKNNKIIGQGYHQKAGAAHAEIIALEQAGKAAQGATLYVTLEPCPHFGRTPPCTNEIIKSGIKNIFIAMLDPNPLNNGKGMRQLKKSAIKVKTGILENEAKKLNEPFIKFITKRVPWVTVKVAQSLDGKIATFSGDSKWISAAQSRNYVQKIRSQIDAIMVGVNTIIKDNPRLTYRGLASRRSPRGEAAGSRGLKAKENRPIKVVIDPELKIPLKAKIFSKIFPTPVIIATSEKAPVSKIKALENKGVKVIKLEQKNNLISLKTLMKELAGREITNLLIEGGGETIAAAFKEKIVDKVFFFIAPKIIGGRKAVTSCEGEGVKMIKQAIKLKDMQVKRIGEDLLVEAYI